MNEVIQLRSQVPYFIIDAMWRTENLKNKKGKKHPQIM
jgi:hypothetical protein